MDRGSDVKRRPAGRRRGSRSGTISVLAALASGGCAVFGGSGGEAGTAESPAEAAAGASEPVVRVDTVAPRPAKGSLEERLLAGDWEGAVAAYAADSALHRDEDATYRAALASAMSGHPAHDPRAAEQAFRRLLEEHPDTSRRLEVEVFLDLLTREQELRAAAVRLERELQQLKAIDLGREPAEGP
ncbi:MAG TPA: hypothetical protein ENO23_05795 [Alphaproteobacteria bacterium]|nr:hypothetical protein [Alphaproteobacteria bacterium]